MPVCFKLTCYEMPSEDMLILGFTNSAGPRIVTKALSQIFPGLELTYDQSLFSLSWVDVEQRVDILANTPGSGALTFNLSLLAELVWIIDDCDYSFCLDFYQLPEQPEAGNERWVYTSVGSNVFHAKYRSWTSMAAEGTRSIALRMSDIAIRHPIYRMASRVAVVPPSADHGSRPNLPNEWGRAISTALQVPMINIHRTREVTSQKNIPDRSARRANQHESMTCHDDLEGHSVILVDDLYMDGHTMREACRSLRAAGADSVFGLCAVKTATGTQGYPF